MKSAPPARLEAHVIRALGVLELKVIRKKQEVLQSF